MTETHDFSDAKVGDKVTCLMFGKGKISEIDQSRSEFYKVKVAFESPYNSWGFFSNDGRWLERIAPTLYHGHVEFEIKVKEPVYEWQWVVRHKENNTFETSLFRQNEELLRLNLHPKFVPHSRIEESKREIK